MKAFALVMITAVLVSVCAPLPCVGQSAATQATPAPNPLQAVTRALAGKWKLDVHFDPIPAAGNKLVEGAGEESWSAGAGGITLVEQEHIPTPFGESFLTGVIWWDGSKHHLAGMECNSQSPATCDLKGGLTDITITWDGKKFQIDEMETHNGRHTIWHEYWTDITPDSFTQLGDVTQPDGTTTRFMTIHGKRVTQLQTIGTE